MTVDEPADEIAPLFLAERERLLELLAGLDPADWRRPSPCPGWTVLGLCAHLAGDDLGFLPRNRDGHHGTPAPEHASEDEFVAWLDAMQDEWVTAARRMSPRIVTGLLAWSGPQIAETMRAQDPSARTASVSWAGTGRHGNHLRVRPGRPDLVPCRHPGRLGVPRPAGLARRRRDERDHRARVARADQ
jgi:uncharacterized protein (TIGR03083 family)